MRCGANTFLSLTSALPQVNLTVFTPISSAFRPLSDQPRFQEWLAARRQIERERRSQARSASAGGDVEARPSTDRSESAPPSLQLCGFIALSGRSVDNVAHLGNIIWEVANDSTVFPELRQIIPNNWRRVWAVLDALRTGADPDLAVRLEGAVVAAKGRDKLEFVTQQQALEVWWRAEQKLATLLGGSVEGSEQPPLAATQQFQVKQCSATNSEASVSCAGTTKN